MPHTRVRRTLVVRADLERVRILDGLEVVARSSDKLRQAQNEEQAHHDHNEENEDDG